MNNFWAVVGLGATAFFTTLIVFIVFSRGSVLESILNTGSNTLISETQLFTAVPKMQ